MDTCRMLVRHGCMEAHNVVEKERELLFPKEAPGGTNRKFPELRRNPITATQRHRQVPEETSRKGGVRELELAPRERRGVRGHGLQEGWLRWHRTWGKPTLMPVA